MKAPSFSKWLLLLVLVLPLYSHAAPAPPQSNALVTNQPGISMEKALQIARKEVGGRVLSATPVNRGDRRGYEVRILVDGKKVRKIFVDDRGRLGK